ncbi:MAG: amino acid ABC transporter permease [Bifidobacteriaceae bacterium]|jgi:polar amino acid transport system permease protein|nr:amino acid ABC transporter permease [Bifidobacteriaceae bacterium]
MTVARLALIYAPWFAVSLAALGLAFRPGAFASARARCLVGALGVVELAYPAAVLASPNWFVATIYVIPAVLAAGSLALLAAGLRGWRRSRRPHPPAPDAAAPSPSPRLSPSPSPSPSLSPRLRLRPRERTASVRGVQYGVLAGAIVVLALATDWELVSRQLLTLEAIKENAPRILPDFLNTLKYTFGAFGVSLSLGLVLALMKLSSAPLYRALATGYIEFFRGLPALIVVFAVAYGLPLALQIKIPTVTLKAALALGCVSAAYMAESIRAGIQAVPKGQIEAARSLGMSHGATLRSVVIPQAFRIVLPPVTNEIILLTKDTSLVYVMGLTVYEYELSKLARLALNAPHGGMTALFAISACYLVITLPLGFLVRRMEKGFGKALA